MIKTNRVIIVEGKYDKIKLSNFIDALIIPTNGFRIFKDKEKVTMIKKLADENGLIIITDSDSAGFMIRNYIKNFVSEKNIINVYIPQIRGKEKRKSVSSKEGFLGLEGLSQDVIMKAFEKSGIKNGVSQRKNSEIFSVSKLFEDELIGHKNSKVKRSMLLSKLDLPNYLSTKELIGYLNHNVSPEEYDKLLKNIK